MPSAGPSTAPRAPRSPWSAATSAQTLTALGLSWRDISWDPQVTTFLPVQCAPASITVLLCPSPKAAGLRAADVFRNKTSCKWNSNSGMSPADPHPCGKGVIVKLSAQVTPGTPHALSVPGLFLSPDLCPLLHSQHPPDTAVGCWMQAGFQLGLFCRTSNFRYYPKLIQ